MNIAKADCGFDPTDIYKFEEITPDELYEGTNGSYSIDLTGRRNLYCDATEYDFKVSGAVQLAYLENMKQGIVYTFVIKTADKYKDVSFLGAYNCTNNNTFTLNTTGEKLWVRTVFTDGYSIYVNGMNGVAEDV